MKPLAIIRHDVRGNNKKPLTLKKQPHYLYARLLRKQKVEFTETVCTGEQLRQMKRKGEIETGVYISETTDTFDPVVKRFVKSTVRRKLHDIAETVPLDSLLSIFRVK